MFMGTLEIRHLRMVAAIAETGNMTQSAKLLFVSQSALSQQLKEIETRLGANLFFRTRKKMILTPIGKKVLDTAKQVLGSLGDAELEIAKMVSGDKGEIRVGTQCIFCYKWLPRVLGMFQNKYPNIEVEIGNSIDLNKELESKTYDLVITAEPGKMDPLVGVPLFEDQMVAILPMDHPLGTQAYLCLEDFQAINLISHRGKKDNRFYQAALLPRGIEPRRFMTVEDPHAIIELVAAGFGISMAPMWAVRSFVEEGRIQTLPVTRPGLSLSWYAAFLKEDHAPTFHREFIHMVSQLNIASSSSSITLPRAVQ